MKPFRFGLVADGFESSGDLVALARRAEQAGYATLLFPDHLGMHSPLPAMVAAAAATSALRVGTQVLNNDFRHPGVLAQEVATADVLTGGRVELGMGAGYMRAEYDAVGLAYAPDGVRVERLSESAQILRRLLDSEAVTFDGDHYQITDHRLSPPPLQARVPLLIGGNGAVLLSAAAQHADIVQFTGFSPREGGAKPALTHFAADLLAERIDLVRNVAGERLSQIELSVLVQRVILADDRPDAAARLVAERGLAVDPQSLLDSPFVLIGQPGQIAEQLHAYRERLGISYATVFPARSEGFDAIATALAGR